MTTLDFPTCFVDTAASHNTVFIDTNLDTHLAMAFSDGDTVSDVKEKIEKEHPLCFPHLGTIKIHAIKVTRGGHFYHLSDSMYLKSAFVGYNNSWFLSIDASIVDGHSTDPNTGNLSTYFERAGDTSVDRINVARSNHSGQLPNYGAPQLQDIMTQQYVNEKAPSKKDLTTKKEEVHSVENCSKHQSGRTRNGNEGLNETLESLPIVKVNHKSKKRKRKSINEHEVVNHTSDDNDQNPLQLVVGFGEKPKEYAHNEVSDHPMMDSKSNVDESGQISSSNARDESEHGRKLKYNLSEKAEVDGIKDKSNYLMDNTSLEVAAPGGSIAKKMRKTEMKSRVMNGAEGERDLDSESRKATSTPKVTSEYLSDKKQTAKVVVGSSSTEPDAHLPETGSNDVKKRTKKKKSKSSACPNQAVGLISSRVEDQQDASRESDITTVPSQNIDEASIPNLLGTSVGERHNGSIDKIAETFAPSLVGEPCDDKNNIELGNVLSIWDASGKAVLGVKRMVDSKDLASKSKDPADLQKSISTSEDANNVQSNHLTCKTRKVVAIPEERDSLQVADTKASMVENCHSSSWDGTDANIKATDISESVHLKGTTENAKQGKKKKIKKSRDSAEERQINLVTTDARDSAQDILPTETQSFTLGDNSCSKAEIGENNVSLMKGENTTSASVSPDVRNMDIDKPHISKVEPLVQINKNQAVAKDMDEQVRKKTKKRPVASMKSTPDLQADSIGNEDSFPSKRIDKEVKPVPIAAKKTKFPKENLRNEIEEANLDSTLFSEVETSPSICKKSKTVGPSLTPSHVSEGYEERSIEANRCSNTTKDGTTDNVDNHVEVPSRSDKGSIEEKADELQHESVKLLVDKLSREKSPDTLIKAKRKKKNLSACSSAASLSMQNIQKSDENTETEEQCQISNSSALKLHVDNKLKKISRGGVKSLPSNDHKQQTPDSDKAARAREKVADSSRGSTEIYNVSLMKGENTTSASVSPDVRNMDIDKPHISKVEPLVQISKNQAVAKDMDEQVRKKTKKRPVASMKSTPDLQADSIGNEDSFPSKRIDKEVKPVSIAAKKTKFSKENLRNEIEEAILDSTLFSEVETSPSICKKSKTVGPSLTPSHVSEGYEERSIEANRCSNTTKDGTTENVDNHVEVPSKSDKGSIEEKANELQHESVKLLVDKLSREKSPDTLIKAKRKKKNLSACSSAASLSMQNIQKSDENTETEEQCQTSNSSALKLHVDNKLKKISRGGVKSLPSNDHKQQTPDSDKAARAREKVADSSRGSTEIYSETSALPKARPKSRNTANMVCQDQKHRGRQSTVIGHPVDGRKSSRSGKKVDSQSQRKNLLLTSGGIFKDASSDSSEDEGGIADSDARSPDNSLISNFSDGESNGSVDLERTNIRRSMRKNEPSSPEHMTLDTILRSSSRYKKAKLTAVQLHQDDTESQPVDFVPDSQPNI